VTLAQLEDDVRFQADLIGATVRHTSAQIRRLINQSIQEFREAISNEGDTRYLVPYSSTLTAGATSPFAFGSLDVSGISPSIVRTYKLDITVDSVVIPLEHRPFRESSDWGGPIVTGIPATWSHFQTAKIALSPAPNAAYPYTLWYLPVLADLSGDSDTFDGVAGWEGWVVWDVVCRLLIRDQQSAAFVSAKVYRDDVWSRIQRQATKVSSAGGAVLGRDTFGRSGGGGFFRPRGPVMAGGGPPASGSVTLDMLADMTGPAVIGRESGTGRPTVVGQTGIVSSLVPVFTIGLPGLVPAAGGADPTLFLTQAGTFEAPAGGGGGGGNPGGPSGSIQFRGLSGFVGYTGFAVQGTPPSMTVRLPGSLRVTGGTVDVGSGTVRISASGIDMGDGALLNSSLVTVGASYAAQGSIRGPDGFSIFAKTPSGADARVLDYGVATGTLQVGGITGSGTVKHRFDTITNLSDLNPNAGYQFRFGGGVTSLEIRLLPTGAQFPNHLHARSITLASGLSNDQAAQMASGTVKAALTLGTPADVQIPTLAAFFPTFTSSRAGLVPTSDGDSNKFLNAVGGFAVPPGLGGSSPTGVLNSQLADMPSGTVKARLTGTGAPQDVLIPTLAMHFPTFTSARAGLVAPGDGDTGKFLNAAGAFATPPAGAGGAPSGPSFSIQFNNSGSFEGATGIRVMSSGMALLFGPSGGLGAFAPAGNMSVSPTGIEALGIYAPTGVGKFQAITVVSGIGNQFLDNMGSGMVKARLSGTGAPQDVPLATLMAFAPTFTSARAGIVPPSDGAATSFLAGDAVWRAPSGAHQFPPAAGATNEQLASVPSGTVKARLSQGVPQDLLIPTLAAFFPTMTSTRAGIVGPGGGTLSNFLRGDGQFAAPTGFFFTPTGLPNANLAPMPSGTVKANLSGTAAPSDILIPTLAAFFPTFTAARAGLVPTSDGDSTKFLNAVGNFAVPAGGAASPGGTIGNIQYNNGAGGFAGASGLNVVASGTALAISNQYATVGDFRGGQSLTAYALSWSGTDVRVFDWGGSTGTLLVGDTAEAATRLRASVGTGGRFEFTIGGVTNTTARILPTGIDISGFHLKAKSLDTPNINGLPADQNQLSRGANIILASGLSLFAPGSSSTGANRFVVPSGTKQSTNMSIILQPTGAKGGAVIRIENLDGGAGTIDVKTPTGTILYTMPSGVKHIADFVFTKPSGTVFEHGGQGNLF